LKIGVSFDNCCITVKSHAGLLAGLVRLCAIVPNNKANHLITIKKRYFCGLFWETENKQKLYLLIIRILGEFTHGCPVEA